MDAGMSGVRPLGTKPSAPDIRPPTRDDPNGVLASLAMAGTKVTCTPQAPDTFEPSKTVEEPLRTYLGKRPRGQSHGQQNGGKDKDKRSVQRDAADTEQG